MKLCQFLSLKIGCNASFFCHLSTSENNKQSKKESGAYIVKGKLIAVKSVKQSEKITERELLISKMRFGIDMPNQETWTLHRIAKLFNISCEHVRQIEVRALKKLRYNPDMQELRHLVIEHGL